MPVIEIGIRLNKDYQYYKQILTNNGLINDFNCLTHDLYYTNQKLDNMTENEMKNACIRLRSVNGSDYKIQNNLLNNLSEKTISKSQLTKFETKLFNQGFIKVFDTQKQDHHFYKEGMTSKVQLQEIEGIGLIVYFDNKNYYEYEEDEQRKKLIDELNSYGFEIEYQDLGLDKLRTLYYKKEMFSNNQNV